MGMYDEHCLSTLWDLQIRGFMVISTFVRVAVLGSSRIVSARKPIPGPAQDSQQSHFESSVINFYCRGVTSPGCNMKYDEVLVAERRAATCFRVYPGFWRLGIVDYLLRP